MHLFMSCTVLCQSSVQVHIGQLTRNVTKDHLREIFAHYGKIKSVDIPVNRSNDQPRGFGYVDFEKNSEAILSIRHMNAAQIDGQEITVAMVHIQLVPQNNSGRQGNGGFYSHRRRSPSPRRRSPARRRGSPPARRGGRSPSPRRRVGRSPSPRRRGGRSPQRGAREQSSDSSSGSSSGSGSGSSSSDDERTAPRSKT